MNMVKKARNALTKMIGFKPTSKNGNHAWVVSTDTNHSERENYAVVLRTDPKLPGLFQTYVTCHSGDADEKTRQEIESQVMKALTKEFGKLYQVENPTAPSIH